MTNDQLAASLARFNQEMPDGEGYGVRITLKSGREYHGDIYTPNANGTVQINPYAAPDGNTDGGQIDDGQHSPMFIEIAEIAAIAIFRF